MTVGRGGDYKIYWQEGREAEDKKRERERQITHYFFFTILRKFIIKKLHLNIVIQIKGNLDKFDGKKYYAVDFSLLEGQDDEGGHWQH